MGAHERKPLWRYLAYAKPYRWLILAMVVAGIVKFTLPLVPAYTIRIILDKVINNAEALGDAARQRLLLWCGTALVVVGAVTAVAVYLRSVTTVHVSSAMTFDVRQDLWSHLQRLGLGFHYSRSTGSLLSRLMSDISVAQQMVNGGMANVVIDLASGAFALAVLLAISWKLTLLALAALPIYAVLWKKVNPRIRQASHDVQEQRSVMSGLAVERLDGIAVVQSFAQERAEDRNFAAQGQELKGRTVRRGRLNAGLKTASQFVIGLTAYGVWILGAMLAIGNRITAGEIFQFTATAALLYAPIRRLSDINIVYQNSMAAIERIFGLFDTTPEIRNRPDVVNHPPQAGRIEFDNVTFAYAGRPGVFQNLSFTVEDGERVAVVGESGAGKSTLVALIPRLYDVTGGAIRIDGTDIRDYKLRKLRLSIGIVLQDTILFSDTVLENLRYGRKGASRREIIEAAKAANAHEFISQLPDGYETVIGERGLTLSGGQRQRVSLARTILQDPRILILDEATSSLDSESENLIAEALERVMKGRTCLIIAHRLSTVIGADRILVLRAGRLVQQGPHVELLAAGGYYRYLFEQQFGPLRELLGGAHKKAAN
ncbi:MAG: ABC transporter ATP-binding protein [Planctomycetota bacterium]|jgi:subfamily B ATP-binding cassette protein MsbA